MSREGTTRFVKDPITKQIAGWWAEAEIASSATQIPRARRFLRWILAVAPYDEEAWLWLARLASTPRAEVAYLQQAIAFHPDSTRTMAALRQARTRQLESAATSLLPRSQAIHCLPDQRRNGHRHATPKNGN
jgi:hypothetical protein